jgi:uncharacterized protein
MPLWSDLGAVWLMALLGGAHCAGMCAPFALAVSVGGGGGAALLGRHLLYQTGKGTAYLSLGLLLFGVTRWLDDAAPLLRAQRWLAVGAGVVMVLTGVSHVWGVRWAGGWGDWLARGAAGRVCGLLSGLRAAPSVWRSLLVGWLNGFLPCGLALGAVLFLGRSAHLLTLFVGSYVFALGTLPVLFALGWAGARADLALRVRWLRLAGGVLMIAGLITLVRGVSPAYRWWHSFVEWCVV